MSGAARAAAQALRTGLLRCASIVVPEADRAEWRREWAGELWHMRRECLPPAGFCWKAERELTAFCVGAFADAVCLRKAFAAQRAARAEGAGVSASVHGSARACLLWLCTAVAICACIAGLLPGLESEQEAARTPLPAGVLLVQRLRVAGQNSLVPMQVYYDWKTRPQRFFASLAFYRLDRVEAGRRAWTVAHASENFFALLGMPIAAYDDAQGRPPRAVLSHGVWSRWFGSNPAVVGTVVATPAGEMRIAGIAPGGASQLPGGPDLWVLEPDESLAAGRAEGFVLAQLSPEGAAMMDSDAVEISAYNSSGEKEVAYRGVAFAPRASGPMTVYLFAMFLALLALPAITTVFASESNFASHPPSRATRLKRAGFMTAKIVLVAALGFYGAVDLAYWQFADYSQWAELLQFAATFNLCLFGLRWALVDQSRRCPVCLRRVTHPAQVGIASCNFLGWNGTEMICMGGHALLHVPSLPTSWFDRERWMYLDASWDFLFGDPVA